ncbi:helix-turn-helix domain-containing protein [Ruminococcus sp. CLA-AA-H200]|uniref:Helix-turn-helix domain-containing protein n=1 Tax=Ruminococcus turbiniformis TaxID=2881258 RepID=A0ABS8G4B0_9FIRM|nr:sugar diacid recognition domain-containing protein [Ruminococcus turbiniformis]MCC2255749.1 helix-turn-helix domain-containing protein [Ruminococcus turbiniformis]
MLEVSLAEKLIEQITRYTSYNVNIMNEEGIIIASRNPERIGTFHEPAWQVIHGGKDIITVSDDNDYPGVSRGINMVIDIDGKREGVVGVTGEPEEIRPVALIIKMSIETMIRYESQKMRSLRRQTKKERLTDLLTGKDAPDPSVLRDLLRELNYPENVPRIPLLICVPEPHRQNVFDFLRRSPGRNSQDISLLYENDSVLIFKYPESDRPDNPDKLFSVCRREIEEYAEQVLGFCSHCGVECRIFVGTLQRSASRYHTAYRHCHWLREHTDGTGVIWFYDHAAQYLSQCLPAKELDQIFSAFDATLSDDLKKSFIELTGSLIRTDFNIAAAAKLSFMHKNTFVYKYNKIRDSLGFNPQNSPEDKWLMICLYLYLTRQG